MFFNFMEQPQNADMFKVKELENEYIVTHKEDEWIAASFSKRFDDTDTTALIAALEYCVILNNINEEIEPECPEWSEFDGVEDGIILDDFDPETPNN